MSISFSAMAAGAALSQMIAGNSNCQNGDRFFYRDYIRLNGHREHSLAELDRCARWNWRRLTPEEKASYVRRETVSRTSTCLSTMSSMTIVTDSSQSSLSESNVIELWNTEANSVLPRADAQVQQQVPQEHDSSLPEGNQQHADICNMLHTSKHGWIISHEEFVKRVYKNTVKDEEIYNLQLKKVLFNINCPYLRHNEKQVKNIKYNLKKKRKNITSNSNFEELKSEIDHIEKTYKLLFEEFETDTIFNTYVNNNDNREAQTEAENCYNEIDKYSFTNAHGSNGDQALIRDVNGGSFLFPNTCRFFCKNITEMSDTFHSEQFDLILLDPPWWNKYIRRKRARSNQGYQMMHNVDLGVIPIKEILARDGLVVVWCTNSPQHLKDLQQEIFTKWGVRSIAKWYWLKVTCNGDPICSFSEPPGKQPFEQILFAVPEANVTHSVPHGKLVVSVPSALHSHKPPLADLLSSYVGNDPRCLEIFARYLLPGWTSWGLEVAKLQHECLYEIQN